MEAEEEPQLTHAPHRVPIPPSLQNVYRELETDLGVPPAAHGDLTAWTKQGVLLLNTVFSVRARNARSHAGHGWETFTDRVIEEINARRHGVVFVLWGKDAGQKASMIDARKHLVLRSSHPSPYSAEYGFLGSRCFSKINAWLQQHGGAPIDWALPPAG